MWLKSLRSKQCPPLSRNVLPKRSLVHTGISDENSAPLSLPLMHTPLSSSTPPLSLSLSLLHVLLSGAFPLSRPSLFTICPYPSLYPTPNTELPTPTSTLPYPLSQSFASLKRCAFSVIIMQLTNLKDNENLSELPNPQEAPLPYKKAQTT